MKIKFNPTVGNIIDVALAIAAFGFCTAVVLSAPF